MATLKFENINKVYDNNVQAVFDFNLEIKDKEFIVFVGPSGCGKSTTLRMVAGLEEITAGKLYIDDELVNEKHPKDRGIAMVFQNYALYPHMTVYKNMAFGLKLRHVDKEEIDKKVKYAAEILGLTDYLDRKPKALSGGQRQRVALGRAIVREPKVFLMDEPLSNLDAKLRVQMRSEITRIHRQVNATTIYVTHDQTEAMTMADRVVVMKDGFIRQIGTPKEIYNNPQDLFVATFIGSPSMNIIDAIYDNGKIYLNDNSFIMVDKEKEKLHDDFYLNKVELMKKEIDETKFDIEDIKKDLADRKYSSKKNQKNLKLELEETEEKLKNRELALNEAIEINNKHIRHVVKVGIRPEDIYMENDFLNSRSSEPIEITADSVELLGRELIIYGKNGKTPILVKTNSEHDIKQGDINKYCLNLNKMYLFDRDLEKRIF